MLCAKEQDPLISRLHMELEHIGQNGLLWVPVLFGVGIGIYFGLTFEPHIYLCVLGIVVLAVSAFVVRHAVLRLVLIAGLIATLGFVYAAQRATMAGGPVLSGTKMMSIEGRVEKIDRGASSRFRLTLGDLSIVGFEAAQTPYRVRVTVSNDWPDFLVGERVLVKARMSPPSGPVEPGGFDFRRHAWFARLGAIGYALGPVIASPYETRVGVMDGVVRARYAISAYVQSKIDGKAAGFAAAVFTGDRSGIDAVSLDDLRASNLAHLLAISGLHMGLLTGFVFALVRVGFALVPRVVLRISTKKIAAVAALLAGLTYLLLSGASVATQRAFVMVAVMFVAIVLERPAITLRAVAIAALVVLLIRPESLISPGFQMSFSATIALVVVFNAIRGVPFLSGRWGGVFGIVMRWFFALFIASFVAGLATAPFSAFHFNQVAQYGLLANLLAVPVMGFVVMPAAVLAVLGAPFGLAGLFLTISGWGVAWILAVAGFVADMEGARIHIASTQTIVLTLIAVGGLLLVLLRSELRWLGVVVALCSGVIWATDRRPDVLIAQSGKLWGVMGAHGRVLNRAKGDGFSARVWLENDGDPMDQESSHARGNGILDVVQGESGAQCSDKLQIILRDTPGGDAQANCLYIDVSRLAQTGAIAVHADKAGLRSVSVSDLTGERLWTQGARKATTD